jgi:hypothetical protein
MHTDPGDPPPNSHPGQEKLDFRAGREDLPEAGPWGPLPLLWQRQAASPLLPVQLPPISGAPVLHKKSAPGRRKQAGHLWVASGPRSSQLCDGIQ